MRKGIPVFIHNQYYKSINSAGMALGIDPDTVSARIGRMVPGYSCCKYQPPKDRKCPKCGITKLLIEFKKTKNNKCGYSYWCKECHAKNVRRYLQTVNGKELSRKRKSKYRKTDKGKVTQKRYRKGSNGKATAARYSHQRRVRVSGLLNDFSAKEWEDVLKNQKNKCLLCGRPFNKKLKPQRDHIIPVSKGGAFTKSNIQALCINCNAAKNDKLPLPTIRKLRGALWSHFLK